MSGNEIPHRTCPLICTIIRENLHPNRQFFQSEGGREQTTYLAKAPLYIGLSTEPCKCALRKLAQLESKHPTGQINPQQRIMGTLFKQLCPALCTLAPVSGSNQCWSMDSSPYSSIHTRIISWNQHSGTPYCQMVPLSF